MTVNNRILRVFNAVAMLLLLSSSRLLAQNLFYNGDFEITSGNLGIEYTDYQRIWSGGVESGQFIHDVTSTNHGSGSLGGWPSNLTGYGGNGYYLLFNGFGGPNNPTKVAWKQTVNVTSQTTYTFSCQLRNLSQSFFGFNANTAIIRIKINGSTAGQDVTFNISNHDWQEVTRTWNSGNVSGPITIEIFDVFTGEPGSGDDFGLDHISFTPNVLYSITANEDAAFVCFDHTVQIPVLNNDDIQPQPSGSNAPTVTVLTPQSQIPGTTTNVTVSNNIISYNFNDPNYSGNTVDFQYRLSWHGLTSDAWIHISLGRPPTIGSINLSSPITLCVGDSLTLPTPTVTPNGSPVTNQGWQVKVNGIWQNVNGNTIPSVANGYTSVRYFAENQCDTAYSNEFQLVVSDKPTIGSISNFIPTSFCAPATFSCSPPSIQNNGSEPIAWGWQMQIGGQWVNVPNPIEYQHNGCNIRYYATNDCGTNYSNTVAITVNAAPIVPNITAPEGVCEGQTLVLTPPSNIQWRHNDPNTCSGCWQVYLNGAWQDISGNSIPSISYNTYNGCHIRYKAHNGCDDGYSNEVAITVYSTQPVDLGDVTFCQEGEFHGVWCYQDGQVYGYDSLTPNNCTIHVSWLFHLSEDYNVHPETETSCGAYYWSQTGLTYHVSGFYTDTVPNPNPVECDDVYVLDLTVNHTPEILEAIEAPESACSGRPLRVTAPQYSMNHLNGGETYWEFATSAGGPFTPFDPTSNNLGYGTYYLRFTVSNECGEVNSNVVVFHINDVPEANMQLSAIQVCEGESLTLPEVNVNWHNDNENDRLAQWQMSPPGGTYAPIDPTMPMQFSHSGNYLRFIAQNSCGTDVVGPVMITVISSEDEWLETITACDYYQLPSGEIITESRVIEYEEYEPCPHTIHQPIEINYSDYVVEPITSCHDEFEWHDMTFYRSDQTQYASVSLTNAYGCDSIVELQLDFGDYAKITEVPQHVCDTFYWSRNQMTYTYDENHPHIMDSVFIPGDDLVCDSMIYLDFTMGRVWEVEGDPMTECSGFVWHGVTYYEDAIIYDSLQTKDTQCDSIIRYQLSIIPPITGADTIVSCQAIYWHGNYYDEDGDYQVTLTSQQWPYCDSIVTLHFSIRPEIVMPIMDVMACGPYYWDDAQVYIDQEGLWSHTFQIQSQGCDSTVYLNVIFIETEIQPESLAACDSYEFHGVVYDRPGEYQIYHDTVFTPTGCMESIQLLNLTINDSEQIGLISGGSHVYVASNLVSGIYRYELDTIGVVGEIVWTLSNPEWRVVEANENYCRIFVSTPGSSVLEAQFMTSSCGWVTRSFEINAGFFGVGEQTFDVKVFPNPTKGTVTIEAEGIEVLRLTNMMGQVLELHECGGSESFTLNLSGYTPSVYLLEIRTVNGTVKKRVVLCR